MINGETLVAEPLQRDYKFNSKLTFWCFWAQIRSPSWLLTCADPWPLERWAALAVLEPQESPELLVQLDIQVPVVHRATEAYQENLEIQVPEVTAVIRCLSETGQERSHFKQFPTLMAFLFSR